MPVHWIVFLVALVPFWLLQNVLHELAHGLAIRLGWGWRFSIWPFPSTRLGRFTFASVVYEPTPGSKQPDDGGWAVVAIMPRLVNGFLLLVSTILGAALWNVSPVAAALMVLLGGCNMVDYTFGMMSAFRSEPNGSDIWVFQERLGIGKGRLRWVAALTTIIGWAMLAVPALRLLGAV